MLDIKRIRDNPDAIKHACAQKGDQADIDRILELDTERRALQTRIDTVRAEVNVESRKIGEVQKAGGHADAQMAAVRTLKESLAQSEQRLQQAEVELHDLLLRVRLGSPLATSR